MAAPVGNQYYLLRTKDGRDKIFKTPALLLKSSNEYFEWCLANPLQEVQIVKYKDYFEKAEVPKMRPFTLEGLCNFLDIHVDSFKEYEKREDFFGVTKKIRQIIENQQYEGAAAGFLNPNIVARKLGLADKQENKIDGTVSFLDALKNARGG